MSDLGRPKRRIWGRFLLIWAIILLLLGAAGCYLLYQYLEVYEVTRPEPVMDAFVDQEGLDGLIAQASNNVPLELTEFEDPLDLYTSYLDAIDLTRAVTYRINSEQSADTSIVYDLRSGPNLICKVFLSPSGDSPGFGRNYWAVSEVRAAPITDLLPSVTALIDAVTGTELMLNGKALSIAYGDGDPVAIPDLLRFEADLDTPPAFVTYKVGPLYGEIRLTDKYETSIAPDGEVADGTVHYQAFDGTQNIRISAPEDLDVYINGIQLDRRDVSSSTLGVFEGLEPYTQGASCMTSLYEIEGLYLKPTVTALDADGSSVTPVASADNSLTFFHKGETEIEEAMLPIVQSFFDAYMDYSAHAFDYTRFSNLLNRILPQSPLYEYVYRSQEAMYWASGTQTDFNDLRYENFHKISDYCFVCTVIYSADMTAKNWYEQYSYELENAYELSFVSTNGRWLAAGMNVITAA